jgi:hypothetical protein
MNGVKQSSHTNPHRLHWKTEIAGKGVVIFKTDLKCHVNSGLAIGLHP